MQTPRGSDPRRKKGEPPATLPTRVLLAMAEGRSVLDADQVLVEEGGDLGVSVEAVL
jgi:hypothetical protein